jgi:hypothetical protein
MKLFSPLLRIPTQVFHNTEIEDAKRWGVENQVNMVVAFKVKPRAS